MIIDRKLENINFINLTRSFVYHKIDTDYRPYILVKS